MPAPPLPGGDGGGRFPCFDVLSQRRHWDAATRRAVDRRLAPARDARFFAPEEAAIARALLDRLVGQPADADPYVDVAGMVDSRLADDETDGWNHDTLPPDPAAWRASLAALDDDARARCGTGFARCTARQQRELIERVRTFSGGRWHGLPVGPLWSLWTRYAATAFYSHPLAWNEMGFPGPAYPRGYKNLGVDRREPFEVRDRDPRDDPPRREPEP